MTEQNNRDSGRAKVTAADVAERAGVSKWTVSRAFTAGASISPDSLKAVLKAADELGYRPNLLARSLTKKCSNMAAVVVDDFTNPNVLRVLDEISRQLQHKGFSIMLLNINADHGYEPALLRADQFQVDGVIFLGNALPDELVQLIQEIRHIPLIVLYRDSAVAGVQVVNTDDYQAGLEVAGLLLDQGYRRVAYMAGPASGSTRLLRQDGFREGLSRQGLTPALLLQAGSYRRQRGYDLVLEYLRATPPAERVEALFCENDNLALGAMDALRDQGGSGSIAIVGFDGIDAGATSPYRLTSYRPPFELLAAEAVRLLEQGDTGTVRYLAEGRLVLRDSHLIHKAARQG